MDVFIARQPIFDKNKNVISYELLFRSGLSNFYSSTDGDIATLDVINSCYTVIGFDTLTDGKKAFINFTEKLLLDDVAEILPKDSVVIEILETIEPTNEIIAKCKHLKDLGYTIALDDFVFDIKYSPLIKIADIIKIDFLQTSKKERKRVIDSFKHTNIDFLAEKIETLDEFNEALSLGYKYFQGYFFSKPTIISGKEIPTNKITAIKIINLINSNELNYETLEEIIKSDVSLSYKLLKFINSSTFSLKTEITSVKHALSMMGISEISKWLSLIALRNIMSDKKDNEILTSSILRAKLGDLLVSSMGIKQLSSDVFFMEILSNIDYFLNKPMNILLEELPISNDIKDALINKNNTLNKFHRLISSYEKGNWSDFELCIKELNTIGLTVDESLVPELYIESLRWSKELMAQ